MGLTKYRQKRNFKDTPEPSGHAKTKSRQQGLRFVVQKHDATRLHYDFRIEVDGVMLSWAVPKGPSLDPTDKRLAMMVEDHPLEYRNFEGVIPAGSYGAGNVIIWDEGTYTVAGSPDTATTQKLVKQMIKGGDLKITLDGQKLKGEFAIVKLKKAEKNAWLLIKHDDEFANRPIINADRSVRSGKTVDEINGRIDTANESSHIDLSDAPKTQMPTEVVPMLTTLVDAPFDHPDWLFELKWDGYRAIAEVKPKGVKLYSRNNISFNADYPDIVTDLANLPPMVLDGEIVVMDEQGRARFQLMQQYRKSGQGNLRYYVFDILYYAGHDLRNLPLERRREILMQVVPTSDFIKVSESITGRGKQLLELAARQGVEGIIAKNCYSKYSAGVRGDNWLKIKLVQEQEVVIGGYTKPNGKRDYFGALILGVYNKKKFEYVGLVGTGFDGYKLNDLKAKLDQLAIEESPFSNLHDLPNLASWVQPKLVAEVNFHEWTDDNLMRQASFIGLRLDKNPLDVTREKPAELADIAGIDKKANRVKTSKQVNKSLLIDPKTIIPDVPLSHPDRVYWPKDKYTKLDLIAYYRDIASIMLPYLQDRPQNLNRFPNGINGENFYHKDMEQELPSFVDTISVYSESNDKELRYMLCNNVETLMYMGYLACLEINPWNSRVDSLDNPDYLVLDLDPNEVSFSNVVATANVIRKILEDVGITSYPKTSGKDGMHVYIPLAAQYTFEQTQQFAQLIALLAQQKLPEIISLEHSPKDRKGKVFIDYLQNRHGQTTACVYSPRPRNGAPVSTPLLWKEVNDKLDPTKFTIKNIFKRIDKLGDLWKPVIGKGMNMDKTLQQLQHREV